MVTYDTKVRFVKMMAEHKVYVIHRGITKSGYVNFSVRGFDNGLQWCFDHLVSETVDVKRVVDYRNYTMFRAKDPLNVITCLVNKLAKDGICDKTDYFSIREQVSII